MVPELTIKSSVNILSRELSLTLALIVPIITMVDAKIQLEKHTKGGRVPKRLENNKMDEVNCE